MVLKNVKPFPQETRDFRIEWDKIESVYEGRLNSCACGCSGDYLYTKTYGLYHEAVNNYDGLRKQTSVDMDLKISRILQAMERRSSDVRYQREDNGVILELHADTIKESYWEEEDSYSHEVIEKGYRVYLKWTSFVIPVEDGAQEVL